MKMHEHWYLGKVESTMKKDEWQWIGVAAYVVRGAMVWVYEEETEVVYSDNGVGRGGGCFLWFERF